tara:strand:- start:1999 stop:2757 length:759 start_codon:yes stop_codon:yes gene_type:complete
MMLLNGDCLELLKTLPSDSIDLIFCDLPYGQTSNKWDCKIDLDKLWIELMRVKKLHTPLFFTTTTKFGVELILSAPKKCFFRYDLVWVKSASAGFLLAKKMPLRKHELVYVFYEHLPLYDLSSHQHKFIEASKPVSVVKENGLCKNYGVERVYYYDKNGKKLDGGDGTQTKYDPPLPTSVLEIDSKRGKHSTQKPVELMEYILKYYSKEGDIVLDPTMGSGSTGVACKNLNRDFIGIEMDKDIFDVATERMG